MSTVVTKPDVTKSDEIARLVALGWDDSRVFHSVGWATPEVFATEELRQMASGTSRHVAYNLRASTALRSLIKQVRAQHEDEQARQRRRDTVVAGATDEDGITLDRVVEHKTERIQTRWPDVNRIFGSTKLRNATGQVVSETPGIPLGKVALLGGEEGAGKTRWYTSLLLHLAEDLNLKCGVFQGEMSASEYKELLMSLCRAYGWTPRRALRNIHVYKGEHHELHCQQIREKNLDFFVWDSFPQLAGSNTKAGIDDIVLDVKNAIRGHCAGLFIVHLNEKGQIKGNNHIRYMADDLFYLCLEPFFGEGIFSIRKAKARSGGRGEKAWFTHRDGGVLVLDAAPYNAAEALHAAPTGKKRAR